MLKEYIQNFSGLSDESWQLLSKCLTEVNFDKGAEILSQDEVCNSIYFIISGCCRSYSIKDGKEINTAFFFENDFVTNIKSLTSGNRSEYTIKAYENVKALKLDKFKLLEAYKSSQEIEAFGRKILEHLIQKQEDHSNSFKLLTPSERYFDLLDKQPDFLQRVSLTQIASYLGISRETLSRIRAK
jgi:CRP-like cAMP-binding protein